MLELACRVLASSEMLGLTVQQGLFFAILIVAFALLITERLRNDLVALLIILALVASGLLSDKDAHLSYGVWRPPRPPAGGGRSSVRSPRSLTDYQLFRSRVRRGTDTGHQ